MLSRLISRIPSQRRKSKLLQAHGMTKVGRIAHYRKQERKFVLLKRKLLVSLQPIKDRLGGRIWFDILPATAKIERFHKINMWVDRRVLKFSAEEYPNGTSIVIELRKCHRAFGELRRHYRSLAPDHKQVIGEPPRP